MRLFWPVSKRPVARSSIYVCAPFLSTGGCLKFKHFDNSLLKHQLYDQERAIKKPAKQKRNPWQEARRSKEVLTLKDSEGRRRYGKREREKGLSANSPFPIVPKEDEEFQFKR